MIADFCKWLAATALSQTFQDASWFVPVVQTLHIVAISFLVVAIGTLGFGLIVNRSLPDYGSVTKLARVFWLSLGVLLVTGALLTITEPARELLSWVFRTKMILVIVLAAVVAGLQTRVRRKPDRLDSQGQPAMAAISFGITILLLGLAIMTAGRWIAYV